jgi:hypothetical protein
MAEEILYEFAKSGTLDAALHLTRSVVNLNPLWVRSFADIQSDEVCHFARSLIESSPLIPTTVFLENFCELSQLNDKTKLAPEEFVKFEADPRMRDGRAQLTQKHANILDILKLVGWVEERNPAASMMRLSAGFINPAYTLHHHAITPFTAPDSPHPWQYFHPPIPQCDHTVPRVLDRG